MNTPHKNRIIKIIIWTVSAIIFIAALLAATAFFWPATTKQLQSSNAERLIYSDAITVANRIVNEDTANTEVRLTAKKLLKPS